MTHWALALIKFVYIVLDSDYPVISRLILHFEEVCEQKWHGNPPPLQRRMPSIMTRSVLPRKNIFLIEAKPTMSPQKTQWQSSMATGLCLALFVVWSQECVSCRHDSYQQWSRYEFGAATTFSLAEIPVPGIYTWDIPGFGYLTN